MIVSDDFYSVMRITSGMRITLAVVAHDGLAEIGPGTTRALHLTASMAATLITRIIDLYSHI